MDQKNLMTHVAQPMGQGSSDFIGSVLKGIVYPKMNLYEFLSSVEQQRKQNKNDLKNLTQL